MRVLRLTKQPEKAKINSSYNKNINNSPFVINQKFNKCFFLHESIIKSVQKSNKNNKRNNSINKSSRKISYSNRIIKKITFHHQKKIKCKIIRNIFPKSNEKKSTNPLKRYIYNSDISYNKTKKKYFSKIYFKEINNNKNNINNNINKRLIFLPGSGKNFITLSDLLTSIKKNRNNRNKEMSINNPKIKLKHMENKLNSEKIKRNKRYINYNVKKIYSKNFNTKNISFNNSKILSDNFSTNYKSLNSKMDINSFHERNKKRRIRTNNITPNISKNIKINYEKKIKKEINNNNNNKLFEFEIENEKNERINGVKINNFNINKPKEENLKFFYTPNVKEKERYNNDISVSSASKVMIGKIEPYKDIIEIDKKNYKNKLVLKKEMKDFSFVFNENDLNEKNNYDYNNDSYYLTSAMKIPFKNNKSLNSISFSLNTEKGIKDFIGKVDYDINKQNEYEKNSEKKIQKNKDNCIII